MHSQTDEAEPSRRPKRQSIFQRILNALHASRRREAKRVLRRYRHLFAQHPQVRAFTAESFSQPSEESQNAHGNTTSLRVEHRTRQGVPDKVA